MDIRACENEDVNKEYATDKARFCYDGLNKKRITEPMIRDPSGNLVPYGWDEVLQSKILSHNATICCDNLLRQFVGLQCTSYISDQF